MIYFILLAVGIILVVTNEKEGSFREYIALLLVSIFLVRFAIAFLFRI